jgi:hypothetical protein
MPDTRLAVAPPERRELRARMRSRVLRADDARRARLILMLAAGERYTVIQTALACNAGYISRWKQRFQEQRLAGLFAPMPAGRCTGARRRWKPAFSRGRGASPPMGRPTGAAASSPGTLGRAT